LTFLMVGPNFRVSLLRTGGDDAATWTEEPQ
jgi:hypothetical protein